jgi:hypothetical protein
VFSWLGWAGEVPYPDLCGMTFRNYTEWRSG